jgi:cytochrome c oxidase subunit 3
VLLESTRPGIEAGGVVPPPAARASGGGGSAPLRFDPSRFGLMAFLGTISMLFVGFTSALLLRRTAADWQPLTAPALLWLNTGVLALSSVALELSRRGLRRRALPAARLFIGASVVLGLLFVAGQFQVWQLLRAQGIFLSSNPAASFFYVLTGVHLVHLFGGLSWLSVSALRVSGLRQPPAADPLSLVALFWHFLGALWLYLLVVLFAI